MVLDEPTSNLDVHAIEELKQTLLGWKAEGKTIAIAEHRLSWLRDLCDQVICMKDGQVAFDLFYAGICTVFHRTATSNGTSILAR